MSLAMYLHGVGSKGLTDSLLLFKSVGMEIPSIQSIPDEVLIKIFKFILLDYERDATFNIIFRDTRSRVKSISILLTLSRVCKAWKAVISAHPSFWTRADGYHKQLLTRVLARAGGLPLSLFVTSETKGLLELFASYGPRIKRLDIAVSQGAGSFGGLTFVPGRSLECFTLNYEDFGTGLQRAFPFFLLGEEILPLKALSIVPFAGHFPANHFPNLTHLHLLLKVAWSGDDLPQRLSSSFFDLLSNTPMLEFLTVSGIGNPLEGFSGTPVSPAMPVVLANLRSVVFVAGGMKTIGMVLGRLSIPQTALIRLHAVRVPTPEVPPLPELSAMQSIDRLHLATEHACLQLVAEGPSSGLWLQGLIEDKEDAGDEDAEDDDAWSWGRWLLTLPEFLPVVQITKLDIYVGPHHTFLSVLLPGMIGVVELSVRLNSDDELRGGDPDLSLARLLYQALSQGDPLLCPRLQVLSIDVDGYRPTAAPDLYAEEMRHMIIFRSRVGHPIDRVVIQPFADLHAVRADLYDDVANRFNELRMEVEDLEVRGPGIPAITYDEGVTWERWSVKGADKYWDMEWYETVMYTTVWDY